MDGITMCLLQHFEESCELDFKKQKKLSFGFAIFLITTITIPNGGNLRKQERLCPSSFFEGEVHLGKNHDVNLSVRQQVSMHSQLGRR